MIWFMCSFLALQKNPDILGRPIEQAEPVDEYYLD